MRAVHHVHDRAVLDIRALSDPDPVHVAAKDGAHPDAALFAHLDVADDLRRFVDEGGRVDAGHGPAVRAEHCENYTGWMGTRAGWAGGAGRAGGEEGTGRRRTT